MWTLLKIPSGEERLVLSTIFIAECKVKSMAIYTMGRWAAEIKHVAQIEKKRYSVESN